MTGLMRCLGLGVALATFCAVGAASAQENLEAGKTPAQLYASDCAICHKSPHGLTKGVRIFGLDSFLRVHYTSSHQSAAAIAAYLQAIDREPAPPAARSKRAAKGGHRKAHKAKLALPPKKPDEAKSSDNKSSATKPAETKSSTVKHEQAKVSDTKTGEAKTKTETKTKKKKSDEAKADASKTGADKPAKDAKPDKSD